MWFWLVSCNLDIKKNLLWDIWLCTSWNSGKKKLWYVSWCMVYRRSNLLTFDGKSAILGLKEKLNHVKDSECKILNNFRLTKWRYNIQYRSQNKQKILYSFWFKRIRIWGLNQPNYWSTHFFHFVLQKWSQRNFNDLLKFRF